MLLRLNFSQRRQRSEPKHLFDKIGVFSYALRIKPP